MEVRIRLTLKALEVLDLRTTAGQRIQRMVVVEAKGSVVTLRMERERVDWLLTRAGRIARGDYEGPASWRRTAQNILRDVGWQLTEIDAALAADDEKEEDK